METNDVILAGDEHQRARITGLVNQIEQVSAEIHHVVDEIEEGVDQAKEVESTIKEKSSLTAKNLTAAMILIKDAEPKLKDMKEQDIVNLSMNDNPPKGVEAIIKCCVYLLANIVPGIEVDLEKTPKETDWKACQRLLRDGKAFIDGLYKVKEKINSLEISSSNVQYAKLIMNESLFEFEKLHSFSGTIADIYSYVQTMIAYYDLVYVSAISQKETELATAKLESSSAKLLQAEEEMMKLKRVNDQLVTELQKAKKNE